MHNDNMNSYGIYRIISPNGSVYIGMTNISFSKRWNQHLKDFRLDRTKCFGLKRAFQKYGDLMQFEILKDMNGYGSDFVSYYEKVFWRIHKAWDINIYNGEPTGTGSVLHTKESRDRISKALKSLPRNSKAVLKVKCPTCLILFETRRNNVYCSTICSGISRRTDEELTNEVINLYVNKAYGYRRIYTQLGIAQTKIARILKENNVEIRSQHSLKKEELRVCKYSQCESSFIVSIKSKKLFCSKTCGAKNRHQKLTISSVGGTLV